MDTYLVGGAVRDQLLHYPHHDRDWVVVGATPEQLLALGYQQVGKDFPVFLHPDTHEEYALARRERKQGSGYHGFICEFGPEISLEEDLSRRDLRINAMAMDPQGRIIDPWGGLEDLNKRLLRHISPAFCEDPLRVIRVARYAARYAHLGFTVADETLELMRHMSRTGELHTLSPERLWTEFSRALAEAHPATFLQVLLDCDAIASLFPPWQPALDHQVLDALDQAAKGGLTVEIRFAISVARLSPEECLKLCDALRASRAAQQMALLFCRFTPLAKLKVAEDILATIEAFDYLRRPELLTDFCAGAALLQPGRSADLDRLQRAAERANSVQSRDFIAKGIKGKALGEALRKARLEQAASLL